MTICQKRNSASSASDVMGIRGNIFENTSLLLIGLSTLGLFVFHSQTVCKKGGFTNLMESGPAFNGAGGERMGVDWENQYDLPPGLKGKHKFSKPQTKKGDSSHDNRLLGGIHRDIEEIQRNPCEFGVAR